MYTYIYMDIYETSCKRWTKWWIWTLNGIVNMLRFMMLYVLYMCWLVRAEGQQRFQCLLSSRSGRRIMQSCWKRKASLQSQIATLVLRCLYIYWNVVCGSMDAYLKTAEGVYDVFNLVKTNCIQIAVEGFLILAFILTSPRNFRTIHESWTTSLSSADLFLQHDLYSFDNSSLRGSTAGCGHPWVLFMRAKTGASTS